MRLKNEIKCAFIIVPSSYCKQSFLAFRIQKTENNFHEYQKKEVTNLSLVERYMQNFCCYKTWFQNITV